MPADTLTCEHCGFANPAGARFCARCGKPQRAACPECGTPIVPGARFCAGCGVPVPGGEPTGAPHASPVLVSEARKVVTVLFADVVGSTGLTEHLDPEEAREVVGMFYRVVQHAVERYGGSVANLLGDAVLAVFGLPVAHEDDPERAVRAALAIRDAMPALNDQLAASHGVRLAVRVGLNTGEVVAASGSTFDRDFLVSDAVTTAARLQQAATPGAIVVGERTFRLTQDAIAYRPLPPLEVKGKRAPLAVWEATAPLPEPAEGRRRVAPLIGRHAELGILRHHYSRCRDESIAQLVTVFGQPGVGKSRLLREFLADVRDSAPPPAVLRGRSVAFGEHVGSHALIDILRAHAGVMDTDAAPVLREKVSAWLRETVDRPEAVLDDLLLTFGAGGDDADPETRRRRLFAAWAAVLEGLAARGPVVLAFEDLHWADEGLLDFVEWVNAELEALPLFVICLARPDLLERRPMWGAGRRNASTINLTPLRPEEAERLVAELSSQGLAPELRQAIAQRAEGNPLFVEELVRMLLEGGPPGAAIPDTVQAVITARIDRLPPLERRVVQAAAVVGRSFWPSAVAALAGTTPEETARAIDDLIAKELVVRRHHSAVAGEAEYAFRHILMRDVAHGMLPRAQRQRAHLAAAHWLEATLGERGEEIVEILAEHIRLGGDDARAFHYLLRAAAKARRLYLSTDALRLYAQAEEAAQRAAIPEAARIELFVGRGEVYQLLGEYPAAMREFERGLAAARAAGDHRAETLLESRVGLIHHRELRPEEAQRHYARAEALARQAGDDHQLGLALVDLANVDWDFGRLRHDDGRLAEGIALLRRAGHADSLARGLNLLCMARFGAGDAPGAITAAEEALAVARAAGEKSREATSLSYLAVINSFWGRYEASVRHGEAAIAIARQIGDRRRVAFTLSFIAHSTLALGDWGTGIRLLEESLPLVREVARIHLPFALVYLATTYHFLGRDDRVRPLMDEARRVVAPNPSWRMVALSAAALAAYANGRAEEVVALAGEAMSLPFGIFIPDDGEVLLPLGDALLGLRRFDDLARLLALVRPTAERFGASPQLAALKILDAHLARSGGDAGRARLLLDEALALARSCGDVYTQWRGLEARLALDGRAEDREALRALIDGIAGTLPDALRAALLAGPATAALRGAP